jgi:hypothetical protein
MPVTCAAAFPCGRYISLLRLLRLGRVYRLYTWVQLMTYNQTFSLLAVTLARNCAVRQQHQRQVSKQQKQHLCQSYIPQASVTGIYYYYFTGSGPCLTALSRASLGS